MEAFREPLTKPTKASATRFFTEHIGAVLDTRQIYPNGRNWEPGPRTLTAKGRQFYLDGSQVKPAGPETQVVAVSETSVTLAWIDESGSAIHYTTYSEH